MTKSPDAFRTISEVADWLGVQAHVLRFWESKFTQIKPVKRAGGRRYYRPADMRLLSGIKTLLYDEGMTIKGVQKALREQGIAEIAALSQPLGDTGEAGPIEYETATVLPFAGKSRDAAPAADAAPEREDTAPPAADPVVPETAVADVPATVTTKPESAPLAEPGIAQPPREADSPCRPGPLQRLAHLDRLSAGQARDLAPLARELRAWTARVSRTISG